MPVRPGPSRRPARFLSPVLSVVLSLFVSSPTPANAAGLVIPEEPDLPPMALVRHAVRVEIDAHGADTTVEQVFHNHTGRRLEARYVFPIPGEAVVSGFSMRVDGRDVSGEVVRNDEARRIYETTIRRSGDAGLLEYLENDVFRASVFPVEPGGRLKITVRFQQALEAENRLVHYVYPLRAGPRRGPTVHGEFRLQATIRSPAPISNVYSPSHPVVVDRSAEREVRVRWSDRDTTLSKDFHLYYSVSDEDVGLDLVTYRPAGAGPGYFMMLVSPRSSLQQRIVERDLVFVIDTSGSMEGEKIRQAKNALRHSITNLNAGDRFALVRFSTSVYPWAGEFLPASEERRRLALEWVDELRARGGTDMAGALRTALSFPREPDRPCFVIFLTDGQPTLGETTDPGEILARVREAVSGPGSSTVRVFTWGIGYDVDTKLLDGIAASAGGASEYVRPEEDIALKVSSFYNRTSHPVLTDVKLELEGGPVRLEDMHPRAVPDLYAGAQLVLLGRYTGAGDVSIRLSGRVNEATESFAYEAHFPPEARAHRFVELLWARRRVGYLLDSIRAGGETTELVEEVVRLSAEYGIQTPYTSYLILRDGTRVAARAPAPTAASAGADRGRGARGLYYYQDRAGRSRQRPFSSGRAGLGRRLEELALRFADKRASGEAESDGAAAGLGLGRGARAKNATEAASEVLRRRHNEEARDLVEGFLRKDGESAVETARYLRRLKEADRGELRQLPAVRKAAGRRFFFYRDLWVDERFEARNSVVAVKFGSAAYFRLLRKHPELVEAFKVSKTLVYVTAPGKALVVAPSGAETLTDAEIAALF